MLCAEEGVTNYSRVNHLSQQHRTYPFAAVIMAVDTPFITDEKSSSSKSDSGVADREVENLEMK